MALFTYGQLGSLCITVGQGIWPFRLSSSCISLLGFYFFLQQLLHEFLATDNALCSRGFCMVSQQVCGWTAELFGTYLLIALELVRFEFIFDRFLVCKMLLFFTLMLCFYIGSSVSLIGVISESFFLILFFSKFGRLVMPLGLIHNLFLLVRLSIKWYQISGLLALLLALCLCN